MKYALVHDYNVLHEGENGKWIVSKLEAIQIRWSLCFIVITFFSAFQAVVPYGLVYRFFFCPHSVLGQTLYKNLFFRCPPGVSRNIFSFFLGTYNEADVNNVLAHWLCSHQDWYWLEKCENSYKTISEFQIQLILKRPEKAEQTCTMKSFFPLVSKIHMQLRCSAWINGVCEV